MDRTDKKEENRQALLQHFMEHPDDSVHTGLNVALKRNRVLGLTQSIAASLRQRALQQVEVQREAERLAAERAPKCEVCGEAHETAAHVFSPKPTPAPVSSNALAYVVPPDADRDDEATWLGAVRHVLGLFAAGEILSATDVQRLGGSLGPRSFWRTLLDALTGGGRLEQARGTATAGPNAAILWAADQREVSQTWLREMSNADDETLAGVVWPTVTLTSVYESAEGAAEPEPVVPTALSATGEAYLRSLLEGNLKLTTALLEGMQLLRDEIKDLKGKLA